MAGRGWLLEAIKNIYVEFRPGPPESLKSEKAVPDAPDIVQQPMEIVGFRSRGGGPVGHPQGVRGKQNANFQYKTPSKSQPCQGQIFHPCGGCPDMNSVKIYEGATMPLLPEVYGNELGQDW